LRLVDDQIFFIQAQEKVGIAEYLLPVGNVLYVEASSLARQHAKQGGLSALTYAGDRHAGKMAQQGE